MTPRDKEILELTTKDVVVLPELESINFRSEEEIALLEAQLLKEGVIRDPSVCYVNEQTQAVIVDGFTRLRIQKKYPEVFGKVVRLYVYAFTSLDQAKDWIQMNQLSRRNLTREQLQFTIGNMYNRYKGANMDQLREIFPLKDPKSDQPDLRRSSEYLGDYFRVGEKTIRRYAQYALGIERIQHMNPALADGVLKGTVRDEKDRLVKVTDKAIEKIGSMEGKLPKLGVRGLLDLVHPPVERVEKDRTAAEELREMVEVFIQNPRAKIQRELIDAIRSYSPDAKDVKVKGMV